MAAITKTQLENASVDADDFGAVVNGPDSVSVSTRFGGNVDTVAKAIKTIKAFNYRGNWASATGYAVKDVVLQSGVSYVAPIAHTSTGSFATDLAAGKWVVHQGATKEELAENLGANLIGFSHDESYDPDTLGFNLKNHVWITDAPFSAKGDNSTDNSAAIQAAEDYLESLGGGTLLIPNGIFKHSQTINKKNDVIWQGSGKNSTIIFYTGTSLNINAEGTSSNRIRFTMKDLCIKSSSESNSVKGITLAWNQRSLPMFDRVRFDTFGDAAVEFRGSNWLITMRELEIANAARHVTGAAAFKRLATLVDTSGVPEVSGGAIADIKLYFPVIEACGNSSSPAGAINWSCAAPYGTQGTWISGACIEGNTGTAEILIDRCDLFHFDGYVETSVVAESRNGIEIYRSTAHITNTRFACNDGVGGAIINTTGNCIKASNDCILYVNGIKGDNRYGNSDILLASASLVKGTDKTLRVKRDSTSGLQGGEMQAVAMGRFNGDTLAVEWGENIASIARVGGFDHGVYKVTFARQLADAYYIAFANAEDSSGPLAAVSGNINNAIDFNITVKSGSTLTDGRQVSFIVFSRLAVPL